MLELIPPAFWEFYEVVGISFFRHVTHFEVNRMAEAMDYALHEQPTFDEFEMLYPRVEDEVEKTKREYPFQFVPLIRKFREAGKFDEAKPHLDALNEIWKRSFSERIEE